MAKRINRREFLTRSGKAAVGAGLGSTLLATGGVAAANALGTPDGALETEAAAADDAAVRSGGMAFWLESSLRRVFPGSEARRNGRIELLAARNERISFQACVRNTTLSMVNVRVSVSGPDDIGILVRRVDYVPTPHHTIETPEAELDGVGRIPGYVPDPLAHTNMVDLGPLETYAFWITVTVPPDARPGERKLAVRFMVGEETKAELTATVDVRSLVIQPRRDFPVTHWWRAEAIWDWYKTGVFDEKWWQIVTPYIENMISHGSNVVYVPIFFMRRETFKRPAQLLKVTEPQPGRYEFDFSDVRRFVKLARECGAEYFEWSHLWIYWGVKNPIRVYTWKDGEATMLWPPDTDGHGPVYRNFLAQFLPAFHKFLQQEKLLDRSFFHLSDEPGGGEHFENYRKARVLLKELAPWMKVMDALSDVQYGKEGLTDIPIPVVSAAQAYIDAGIPHWVYFCCAPRGAFLNRFFDTPLAKIRMSGWLFYHLGAKGFLHWGYNYWHRMESEQLVDPFTDASGGLWPGIPHGDPFMVYPGPNGPIDSIRWEVFAESLQDYALLQTAGIDPGDALLSPMKTYADFPKTEEWIREARRRILTS